MAAACNSCKLCACVAVDLRGLSDTTGSPPLTATITIRSTVSRGLDDDTIRFLRGSEALQISVELHIEAEACIDEAQVTGSSGQAVQPGETVGAGDRLTVVVNAFDADACRSAALTCSLLSCSRAS